MSNESKSQHSLEAFLTASCCSKFHEIKDLSEAKERIPLKKQLLV